MGLLLGVAAEEARVGRLGMKTLVKEGGGGARSVVGWASPSEPRAVALRELYSSRTCRHCRMMASRRCRASFWRCSLLRSSCESGRWGGYPHRTRGMRQPQHTYPSR